MTCTTCGYPSVHSLDACAKRVARQRSDAVRLLATLQLRTEALERDLNLAREAVKQCLAVMRETGTNGVLGSRWDAAIRAAEEVMP